MNPASPASRSETRWGLQLKVILSMLLVGVVPLMVGLGLAFWQGSREIQVVNGESFKALAEETARKVDLLMSDEVGRTARIAADPSIILELEQRRDALLDMTEDERRRAVNRLKEGWEAKDPAAVQAITGNKMAGLIQEYVSGAKSEADQLIPQVVRSATKMLYITDIEGNLVAALTTLPPFANKETAWWKGASHRGSRPALHRRCALRRTCQDLCHQHLASHYGSHPIWSSRRDSSRDRRQRVDLALDLSHSLRQDRTCDADRPSRHRHELPHSADRRPNLRRTAHSPRHAFLARLGQCAERWPRRNVDFDYRIRPGAGNQPCHQRRSRQRLLEHLRVASL